ncbi:MAG TPA: hypothetical protein PLR20_13955 [Syntrophales bacterium]|nr:hypothetical protein [Syntrophales bacterium]HQM30449.1 hypothetical protein [Syntrophales bacterium]
MNSRRLFKLAVIIAMGCQFVFVSPNDVRGVDWIHYGTDPLGNNFFYNQESVSKVTKDLIKIWTTTVLSDEGRANLIKTNAQAGIPSAWIVSLNQIEHLWYISCEDKRYNLVQSTYYASDGSVLSAIHYDDSWSDVSRGSMTATLMKKLCKELAHSK